MQHAQKTSKGSKGCIFKSQLKTHLFMNVSFQNHVEEKQCTETILVATYYDGNRINTLKQKLQYYLKLSAGHPLPIPIARLLRTCFRFGVFQQTSRLLVICFCFALPEPQSQDVWNSVFLDISFIFHVLLKPRLNLKTPAKPFLLYFFDIFCLLQVPKTFSN